MGEEIIPEDRKRLMMNRPAYHDDIVAHIADASDQRNYKQLAEDLCVPYGTLTGYIHRHREALFAAADKIRQRYIPILRTAALKSLFANVDKSFNDRQLALKITGDLVENTKTSLDIKTPEEKRAAIAMLMQGLSDKLAAPGSSPLKATDESENR